LGTNERFAAEDAAKTKGKTDRLKSRRPLQMQIKIAHVVPSACASWLVSGGECGLSPGGSEC